jgi:phage gp16-like protein
MSRPEAERRRKQLAAIHAAKRTLDMDNDTYRALLERVSATAGPAVRSAGQLDPGQIYAVLEELKRLGGLKPSPKTKGKPANFEQLPEMITKVEALLADMKLPWSYADAIAMRQFRIQRVAWCRKEDQLRAIIAALHVEQEKRELLRDIEATCARLETNLEGIEQRYRLGSPRWRRNRDSLRSVRDALARDFPHAEATVE